MNKETIRARIEEIGIVPAIRLSSAADALFAVKAVADSGIPVAEVTMTVPGAIEVISELVRDRPELIVGAGTVVDAVTARRCLDAGAMFLSSPGLDLEVVEFAVKQNVVVFPGALTPSEIMAARKAGSDFVKVFPCSRLGGASYISSLKSPFPHIPLIASGGVTQGNTADFILAGAAAVGIGRDLINPEAGRRRELDWIRELAGRFLQIVKRARSQKAT
ncbi:MAG TPA: bifunctional 4-hydroxy-2-oxoglutarate aldolase/2-dehydro-3-deoxy-phosphogluconate aldolase [Bryobacteraceae bacterium]|jgi:2-dehydro-3-deoxyphosphogluconate aldolase/(4S)-4-hydroxy-2-oxoglutarate aldolase|nr:bifunctional 4-hydroxy-2-oxoglutarate aldolase/2-dehydro-3-deoxy-phosphogluconate aldolase [Bryobacteraceae bacterium]